MERQQQDKPSAFPKLRSTFSRIFCHCNLSFQADMDQGSPQSFHNFSVSTNASFKAQHNHADFFSLQILSPLPSAWKIWMFSIQANKLSWSISKDFILTLALLKMPSHEELLQDFLLQNHKCYYCTSCRQQNQYSYNQIMNNVNRLYIRSRNSGYNWYILTSNFPYLIAANHFMFLNSFMVSISSKANSFFQLTQLQQK